MSDTEHMERAYPKVLQYLECLSSEKHDSVRSFYVTTPDDSWSMAIDREILVMAMAILSIELEVTIRDSIRSTTTTTIN